MSVVFNQCSIVEVTSCNDHLLLVLVSNQSVCLTAHTMSTLGSSLSSLLLCWGSSKAHTALRTSARLSQLPPLRLPQEKKAKPPVAMHGKVERKQNLQQGGRRNPVRSWRPFHAALCGHILAFYKNEHGEASQTSCWCGNRELSPTDPQLRTKYMTCWMVLCKMTSISSKKNKIWISTTFNTNLNYIKLYKLYNSFEWQEKWLTGDDDF